ncbi:MAG: NINE protein [Cyanobacteria bacterium]|nr:NINE protein [Cyanobacteriota bacterium]MDW8202819.1 NINE protein [Cyanobacteriota bacterium SKYGB_h_bin112]
MLTRPKDRKIAALLAFAGVVLPISGLHKFYLGQPGWGILYVLLSFSTPIARIAAAIEGVWYLSQDGPEFDRNFNATQCQEEPPQATSGVIDPAKVGAVADALRQLDQLRQEGLISDYEFEQKRRQLLDHIG